MRNLIAIFLGLGCIISCSYEDNMSLKEAGMAKITRINNLNNKEIPAAFLSLHEPAEEEEGTAVANADISGNLYGKFFNERAEFFIIDNPKNKLHHTKVKTITLYYLDGQLGKTKYILEQDAATRLIECHGSFKISAYDDKNREILKSGKVLVRKGEDITLNQELDNYQLKWTSGNHIIVYKVNLHDEQETYRYVEKRDTYEQNFREVEKSWVANYTR